MAAPHYPIFLVLEGRLVLVVGGGEVAARKVEGLVECGARVAVVAPELGPAMERQVAAGRVEAVRREFEDRDVAGAMLVVAATDDEEVNRRVAGAARARGAIVNVVDRPPLCDFIAPAVLRRGHLTVAVSTSGASPALAGRVARELGERFGPEWAVATDRLAAFRDRLHELAPGEPERRRALLLEAARLDAAALVREGGAEALDRRLEALLASGPASGGDR